MAELLRTPEPPYTAVVFSSLRPTGTGDDGYAAMAEAMEALGAAQPGFLGIESARGTDGFGITVSYWRSEADAVAWKQVAAHRDAQTRGRNQWYSGYVTRVATVTRSYRHDG